MDLVQIPLPEGYLVTLAHQVPDCSQAVQMLLEVPISQSLEDQQIIQVLICHKTILFYVKHDNNMQDNTHFF